MVSDTVAVEAMQACGVTVYKVSVGGLCLYVSPDEAKRLCAMLDVALQDLTHVVVSEV